MNNEIWKSISGYEGLYEISNEGNVRSLLNDKIKVMTPVDNGIGYLLIGLTKDGKRKFMLVHRLVYSAFKGEIPDGMCINHHDECKANNNIDNLELMTIAENINFGTRNSRSALSNKFSSRKGSIKERKPVFCFNNCTIYSSSCEAARELHIYQSSIVKVCTGKCTHTHGYKFRYATSEEIQRLNSFQTYIQTSFSYTDFEKLKKVESNEVKQVESYSLF